MEKTKKEFKKEFKRVMLFDRFAGWTLAFSIMATFDLVWGLIYIFGYDNNQSFALQFGGEWFVLVCGAWMVFGAGLFIINCIFASIEAHRAQRLQSKMGVTMYIASIFIPYLGFGYHIDYRRTLIYVGNRLYREDD